MDPARFGVWLLGVTMVALVVPTLGRSACLLNLGSLALVKAEVGRSVEASRAGAERALAYAHRALRIHPDSGRARTLAGVAEAALGSDASAIAELNRAIEADATDTMAHFRLGALHQRRGNLAAAIEHWRAAGSAASLVSRGLQARARGDVARSRDDFDLATKIDPQNYQAWLELGATDARLGKLEDACRSYEEAIRRRPAQSEAYRRLAGLYYLRLKDPATAGAVVERGLATARPPGDGLYAIRSRLRVDRRDYAAAERDARVAIELSPRNGSHLAWLGDVFYLSKRYPQALAQYQETVRRASGTDWEWLAHQRAGRVYAAEQKWDAAIAEFRSAVTRSLERGTAARTVAGNYVALGDVLLRAGKTADARQRFREALVHDPNSLLAARRLAALDTPQGPR